MKKLICFTVMSLGLMGSASLVMAAGDANKGKEQTAICAACHGTDGNSTSGVFPKLANLGERYLFEQLKAIQSGERAIPEMAGQLDGKSDQDLRDIAAYFGASTMQLSGAKPLDVKLNNSETVDGLALGQKLFRGGNAELGVPACTGCHSPRGQGNAPAGYPRIGGQHPEYIEKQLKAYRAGERSTDGEAKIMRSVARALSDAEIKALAAYIAGLH